MKIIKKKEKFKKELSSFVKNKDSIYPIINGCKMETPDFQIFVII